MRRIGLVGWGLALVLLASGCATLLSVPTPTPAPRLVLGPEAAPARPAGAPAVPPVPAVPAGNVAPVPSAPTPFPIVSPTPATPPTRVVVPTATAAPPTPTPGAPGPAAVGGATAVASPPADAAPVAPADAAPVAPPTAAPAVPPPATKPAEAVPAAPSPTPVAPTATPVAATETSTPLPPTATPTVSATATASPSASPSPTVTVAPSQIGQRIVSGPVGLTTHALATAPAPDGKLYVIVELSIENVGQGSLGYSPIYFRLSDASGAGYVAGAPGTTLPAAAGPTGLLARANVAFEVPAGARGLTLSYEPTPVPSGYQTIKIALGE